MNNVPKVSYRFKGESWDIRDFVNPRTSISFGSEDNGLVAEVSTYIRDNFTYPLFGNDTPSSDAKLHRFHRNLCKYYYSSYVYYMWSFPNEVLAQKFGICIDTANLATSLLISKLDAWTCLGEVRTAKEDYLLGYHAWTECPYKDKLTIMEGAIHTMGLNTLVTASSAYKRDSDWANQGNLYYLLRGKFNNGTFKGDASIVASMNLPAKRVWLYGLDKVMNYRPRQLYKEWKREEINKLFLIQKAYGVKKWKERN